LTQHVPLGFCFWLLLLLLQAPGLSAWDDPQLHRMLRRSAKWQVLQNRLCRQELACELCTHFHARASRRGYAACKLLLECSSAGAAALRSASNEPA
jgi:hypothetical protein